MCKCDYTNSLYLVTLIIGYMLVYYWLFTDKNQSVVREKVMFY